MNNRLLTVAALLITAPAAVQAYPQWLAVGGNNNTRIDYNSIRAHANGIRSVDSHNSRYGAATVYVSCDKWRYTIDVGDGPMPWEVIPPQSPGEITAYILCPGDKQQEYIRYAQEYTRAAQDDIGSTP